MANTMKKLLSLVIAVVMVLSTIPAVSATETDSAEQTTTTRGAALGTSKTYTADEWVEVGTAKELLAAMKNGAGVNAEENQDKVMGIKLTDNITFDYHAEDADKTENDAGKASGTLLYAGLIIEEMKDSEGNVTREEQIRAQTLIVDLNGKTLKTDETVKLSRLFGAYGDSDLTIINGTVEMDGTYTGYSAFVFFHKGSKVTLDGVCHPDGRGCEILLWRYLPLEQLYTVPDGGQF